MTARKNIIRLLLSVFFPLTIILSCSSPQKSVHENKPDDTYIFDEVPPEDIYTFETPVDKEDNEYVVQIGAFSSLERAKHFADISRIKLQKDIKVNYSRKNNLYVVQIHPPFKSKEEAEYYRNELWKISGYDDAWIVVISEDNQ